jgi:hypothetical protein
MKTGWEMGRLIEMTMAVAEKLKQAVNYGDVVLVVCSYISKS